MASSDLEHDEDTIMSSPGSSDLSDPPSEEEYERSTAEGQGLDGTDEGASRPRKRRRTGNASHSAFQRATSSQPEPEDDTLSLSEDGFSSAPGSPTHDEWSIRDDAQLECQWRDCDFGKAVNNDDLVQHVQTMHCATGGPKKTKYICEWGECQKKASNHPSGYALKAHMRSHTKEKPYYCALPECDKAFTRSDALAKHMRTVHEPEPSKASGMYPQLQPPTMAKKPPKQKLSNGTSLPPPRPKQEIIISHDADGNEIDSSPANDNITYMPALHPVTGQPGYMIHYPADIHFSGHESAISAIQLMRVLRRQIKWAEDEHKVLELENAELERIQKDEWVLKEILLEGLTTSEKTRAGKINTIKITHPKITTTTQPPAESIAPKPAPARRRKPGPAARKRAKAVVKEEATDNAPALASTAPVQEEPRTSPPADDGADEDGEGEGDGREGGFDGEEDPYDNYLQDLMKRYNTKGETGAEDGHATRAAPRAAVGDGQDDDDEDEIDDAELSDDLPMDDVDDDVEEFDNESEDEP